MSKVLETRVENLRRLVDSLGGGSAVSSKLGYSNSSYLSQLIGPNPSRPVGERAARNIEHTMGLPEGWLDMPNASMVNPTTARPMQFTGGEEPVHVDVPVYGKPPATRREFNVGADVPAGPTDLPVFGAFRGGFEGSEINYQDPVDVIARPPQLSNVRNACAVYIVNDSMEPRYFPGEMALVHPGKPVRNGDYVAVELTNGHGLIKRLLRRTDDYVELEQHNPPEKRKIPRKDIAGIYKIIGTWTDG